MYDTTKWHTSSTFNLTLVTHSSTFNLSTHLQLNCQSGEAHYKEEEEKSRENELKPRYRSMWRTSQKQRSPLSSCQTTSNESKSGQKWFWQRGGPWSLRLTSSNGNMQRKRFPTQRSWNRAGLLLRVVWYYFIRGCTVLNHPLFVIAYFSFCRPCPVCSPEIIVMVSWT